MEGRRKESKQRKRLKPFMLSGRLCLEGVVAPWNPGPHKLHPE